MSDNELLLQTNNPPKSSVKSWEDYNYVSLFCVRMRKRAAICACIWACVCVLQCREYEVEHFIRCKSSTQSKQWQSFSVIIYLSAFTLTSWAFEIECLHFTHWRSLMFISFNVSMPFDRKTSNPLQSDRTLLFSVFRVISLAETLNATQIEM